MKRLVQTALILPLLLSGSIALAAGTGTSTPPRIQGGPMSHVKFPVKELGNCASQDACKAYCDIEEHHDACFIFALRVGLMSKEKIDLAKQVLMRRAMPPMRQGGATSTMPRPAERMGSSTLRERPELTPRMGSTTRPMPRDGMSSTTAPHPEMRKAPPPQKPGSAAPENKESLGAMVIGAFAHLLGL